MRQAEEILPKSGGKRRVYHVTIISAPHLTYASRIDEMICKFYSSKSS